MDEIANEIQATQIHDQISHIIPSIRTGCSDSEKEKKQFSLGISFPVRLSEIVSLH